MEKILFMFIIIFCSAFFCFAENILPVEWTLDLVDYNAVDKIICKDLSLRVIGDDIEMVYNGKKYYASKGMTDGCGIVKSEKADLNGDGIEEYILALQIGLNDNYDGVGTGCSYAPVLICKKQGDKLVVDYEFKLGTGLADFYLCDINSDGIVDILASGYEPSSFMYLVVLIWNGNDCQKVFFQCALEYDFGRDETDGFYIDQWCDVEVTLNHNNEIVIASKDDKNTTLLHYPSIKGLIQWRWDNGDNVFKFCKKGKTKHKLRELYGSF